MRNVTVNSIGEYIREQREQAKISMRQLAQSAGVSNPYLSQIERGLRKPSADILQQIAKGLRISAEALYVQAGILEDRPADSGVRSALLADPQLSERQKQVLMEIYESFRRENAAAAEGAEATRTRRPARPSSPPGRRARKRTRWKPPPWRQRPPWKQQPKPWKQQAAMEAEAEAAQTTDQQTVTSSRPDSASD